MRKLRIPLLVLLTACTGFFSAMGQTVPPHRTCGTTAAMDRIKTTSPKTYENMMRLAQVSADRARVDGGAKAVTTIPVVVHVVWNTAAQNISDAQVLSGITALNEDFRKLNADRTGVPAEFAGVAADCEIEFCMAQRDPSGNATNGIVRVNTTQASYTDDNVKDPAQGGSAAWDNTKYLNVWLCNLGGGLLGYAYFPGAAANIDGVVIGYDKWGTKNLDDGSFTLSAPYDLNRTATHEICHYFAIDHIWGPGGASCTADDGIADTPMQNSENYGCPAYPQNSCGSNDMTMNYMDYVNDACMFMFSQGQADKMNATLNTSRVSLKTSDGCLPLTALDASISAIVTPSATACSTTITPVVTIKNNGSTTLTSATINYDIDGGGSQTFSWTGSLTAGQTENVTLPNMTTTGGAHTFNASTSAPNAGTDENTANDASAQAFTIVSGSAIPIVEGFEGATYPPANWTITNGDGDKTWVKIGSITGAGGTATNTAYIDHFNYNSAGQVDELVTDVYTFVGVTAPQMTFDVAYARYDATNFEKLQVYISEDCGGTWVELYNKESTTLATVADQGNTWAPGAAGDWRNETLDLTAYANKMVKFKFVSTCGYGNNIYLDNINIQNNTVCTMTASAVATDANCNGESNGSIDVTLANSGGSETYVWTNGAAAVQDPTGLAANTYNVTVTDGAGCTATTSATVNQPTALTASAVATDANCNGESNGSIALTPAGGNGGNTFAWDNGAGTGEDPTGLAANTYNVTVTDSKGCTATASATVGQPTTLTASAVATDANCNGDSNGSIALTPAGGNGTNTFAWDNGAGTNEDPTGLSANTYNVTLTDSKGCTATASATVGQPTALTASAVATDASCGASDGSIALTPAGGNGGNTFAWDNGAGTGEDPTGLGPNTYSVTVTDSKACTATASATVGVPAAPTASAVATDANCNGESTGSIALTVTGGSGGNTFVWDNGAGTNEDPTSLAANTYSVTVTDGSGCTATASATVNQPATLTASAVATDASCNGDTDGSINLTTGGGNGGNTFVWNNGAGTNEDPTGLGANTYNVTVTDSKGCVATASTTLGQPTTLAASAVATDANCNGDSNGSIALTVSGGNGGNGFAWDNGAGTNEDPTGLAANTYAVTVTDSEGCSATTSATVNQPTALTASAVATDASCGATDGSIALTAAGGNGGNTFAWDNSAGTNEDPTGLGANTYTVTVTDSKGCTVTASATVNQPNAPTLSAVATDANCNGDSNGSIALTVSGGSGGNTFAWDNGAGTNEDPTGLAANTYAVTVTDGAGCTATTSATVNEPTTLTASAVATDATCNGASTGSIALTVAGGNGGNTFAWDNGAGTNEDPTNLAANTYTVTATDSKGCIANASATVGEPTALTASAVATDASCNGTSTGSIALTVSGGSGGNTFAWDNSAGTNEDPTGLAANTYSVTVTNGAGCSTTASATVGEPTALTASAVATDATCGNANGSIALTVSGGNGGNTFAWDNGAGTNEDPTGLNVNTYTVTVTDAQGCTTTASATVSQPSSLSASAVATNSTCNGADNGSIALTVSGGAGSNTFAWDNGAGSNEDPTGLAPNTYTVTITDGAGCSITSSATTTEPTALTASAVATDATCNGESTGSIALTVAGGNGGNTFAWDNGAGSNEDPTGLAANTYSVTVTDAQGCSATANAAVGEPTALTASALATDATCGAPNGSIALTVSGGSGGNTFAWDNGAGSNEDPTGLAGNTYSVTVTDAAGCTTTASATVGQASSLTASAVATNSTCNGTDDGSINLTVSGGAGSNTFAWDNGAGSNEDPSNLAPNTYSVTVTDGAGCTATASASTTEPNAITATAVASDATCNGDSNGSIALTVSGGSGGNTFAWDNGAGSNEDPTGLAANTYSVTVTDGSGCSATASATVAEPTALTASAVATDESCAGSADGSIALTVAGGNGGNTFAWDNGAGSVEDPTNLSANTYSVVITDGQGCVATANATVNAPSAINVTLAANDASCGNSDGSVTSTTTGGGTSYSYDWSNGGNTADISGLDVGSFTLTVTDNNGCSAQATAFVSNPTPTATITNDGDVTCNGGNDGAASVSVVGGTTPLTYDWSNGSNTTTATGLSAGTATVTVTDAAGCKSVNGVVINEPAAISSSVAVTGISCNGSADGEVDANVTGGTSPYNYLWSNGATTEIVSGLSAGAMNLIITDANGCTGAAVSNVSEPTAVSVTTSCVNTSGAGNNDGSSSAVGTGGSGSISYEWNNGANTAANNNLIAGLYTVTATDANGCIATAQCIVNDPGCNLSLTTSSANISCNGANDGSIGMAIGGGTLPYAYIWSNGATTSSLAGLGAGNYDVTITDNGGCEVSSGAVITEPSAISLTQACFNVTVSDDGGSAAMATGGTGLFTYAWTNGATTSFITNLAPGTYGVTATDENGCVASSSCNVDAAACAMTSTATSTNTSCDNDDDGTMTATATNGTEPYIYSWSNGSSGASVSNVEEGTYAVTITDAQGCTSVNNVTVEDHSGLSAFTSSTLEHCGQLDAIAQVIASGGTAPYAYQWDDAAAQTAENALNLGIGTYGVSVTDANGCVITRIVEIDSTGGPFIDYEVTDESCAGLEDAQIAVFPSGTEPFVFGWNVHQNNDTLVDVGAGTYNLVVTDAHGCSTAATIEVGVDPDGCMDLNIPSAFTPNGDGNNDTWILRNSSSFPSLSVEVFNRWGSLLFSSQGYDTPWDGTYEGDELPAAAYYYIITRSGHEAATGTVTIVK